MKRNRRVRVENKKDSDKRNRMKKRQVYHLQF